MDIGFDHISWQPSPAAQALAGRWSHAPEWPVLQARLGAAWSARREFAAGENSAAGHSGSFDRGAALVLAGLEYGSHAVNPIALANRKPDGGIAVCLAGDFESGTRG